MINKTNNIPMTFTNDNKNSSMVYIITISGGKGMWMGVIYDEINDKKKQNGCWKGQVFNIFIYDYGKFSFRSSEICRIY